MLIKMIKPKSIYWMMRIALLMVGCVQLSWAAEIKSDNNHQFCVSPKLPQSKSNGIKVVFLNPGESTDKGTGDFWLNVSKTMQSSAHQLGLTLEIFYAQRDHLLAQQQADDVLKRKDLPDFLVVVNEKTIAEPIIKKANAKGVRTLLILNEFSAQQKKTMGAPREKYPCWIGEIIPDNRKAGYLLAQQLTEQMMKKNPQIKKPKMLALLGDYVTPASFERERGLQDFLDENPNVQLVHRYVGLWRSQRAQQMVMTALQKNTDIDLVWAANNAMALGALTAIQQQKREILVGGINWDAASLQKLSTRELAVDVGGHFIVGGWAMVLLNDYARGNDFASESLSFKPTAFAVLTADSGANNLGNFLHDRIHPTYFVELIKPNQSYRFDINALLVDFLKRK